MSTVDLPIVDLHVQESGSGTPLVLLHAFPLSSAMWREQRESLSDVARVITPDLRGFGGSALGGDAAHRDAAHRQDAPSLDLMADDVAATFDLLGLGDVVLGGLSMGGYVAMAFLRRHPGRVRALVLADTKASADSDAARAKREAIATRCLAEQSSAVLVEEVLPTLCGETTRRDRPTVLGRVRALVDTAPPAAAAWAQRAMANRPDSTDTLRALDLPALVVVGSEDELSPLEEGQQMVAALPQGRLVVIDQAGHLSAVERPDAFAGAVRDFLGGLR